MTRNQVNGILWPFYDLNSFLSLLWCKECFMPLTSFQSSAEDVLIVFRRAVPALVPELILALLDPLLSSIRPFQTDSFKLLSLGCVNKSFVPFELRLKRSGSCWDEPGRLGSGGRQGLGERRRQPWLIPSWAVGPFAAGPGRPLKPSGLRRGLKDSPWIAKRKSRIVPCA